MLLRHMATFGTPPISGLLGGSLRGVASAAVSFRGHPSQRLWRKSRDGRQCYHPRRAANLTQETCRKCRQTSRCLNYKSKTDRTTIYSPHKLQEPMGEALSIGRKKLTFLSHVNTTAICQRQTGESCLSEATQLKQSCLSEATQLKHTFLSPSPCFTSSPWLHPAQLSPRHMKGAKTQAKKTLAFQQVDNGYMCQSLKSGRKTMWVSLGGVCSAAWVFGGSLSLFVASMSGVHPACAQLVLYLGAS